MQSSLDDSLDATRVLRRVLGWCMKPGFQLGDDVFGDLPELQILALGDFFQSGESSLHRQAVAEHRDPDGCTDHVSRFEGPVEMADHLPGLVESGGVSNSHRGLICESRTDLLVRSPERIVDRIEVENANHLTVEDHGDRIGAFHALGRSE